MEFKKLHLKGVDGSDLLLQTESGTTYAVKIDADLRFAILSSRSKEATKKGKLSLQNVQKALREGVSVDELVKLTGIEAARIEKYNIPIAREKQYAINSFQKVDVRIKDGVMQVRKLLDSIFTERGYKQIEWIATRKDANPWEIILTYALDKGKKTKAETKSAVWTWNPKTNLVRTLNKEAEDLFGETREQEPLPKDKRAEFFENFNEPLSEQQVLPQVQPPDEGVVASKPALNYPELPVDTSEPYLPIPSFSRRDDDFMKDQLRNASNPLTDDIVEQQSDDGEQQTPQHNIVRVENEENATATDVVTSPMIRVAQTSSFRAADVEKKVDSKKPKRPQLPEWDEILFGPAQN